MLEYFVELIRSKFSAGPPNGWLEQWDVRRFEDSLRTLVHPHVLTNQTSFDYAFCNTYDVQLDGDGPDAFLVLTIRASYIADVISLHWTRYEQWGAEGFVVANAPSEAGRRVESNIREFFARLGFSELSERDQGQHIDGVELELSRVGDVTVGKCLFQDYDG